MFSCWLFKCITVIIYLVVTVSSFNIIGPSEDFHDQRYYNISEISSFLREIEEANPTLAKVHEIGKSVMGQSILAIEITSNVRKERSLLKPMFKYVANIHGDEPIGVQLLLYLAQYLIMKYGEDKRITKLVDSTDIFLVPTLNPDGYSVSIEGECDSVGDNVGKNNANGVNLNRDFPGPDKKSFDNLNNKQPETRAIIDWILNNPFVMSGSFHGGDILAIYPFNKNYGNTSEGEKTPDDKLLSYLASTYAINHIIMNLEYFCGRDALTFKHGVANGAKRYEYEGGMQDFNYIYSNCFEITFEITCCKYPKADELDSEWLYNREAMLIFMENVHMGIKGLVYGKNDTPISGALVDFIGINHPVKTTTRGEFWRLLLPGNYTISIKAPNYETYIDSCIVKSGYSAVVHITLKPLN